jgi:AraC family transcriptional regulator
MELFGKGIYSGKVIGMTSTEDLVTSITSYDNTAFNNSKHFHSNAHISYVLHGGCVERKKQSYERAPGKITFYYAEEPHQIVHIPHPSRHINIEIENKFFLRNGISDSLANLTISRNPDVKFLMLKIYKEFIMGDRSARPTIEMLLLNVMLQSENGKPEQNLPRWVMIIDELLHDKWNEKLSLDELALAANIHPVTISRYFRKYFSCTLGEYMRKIRIEKSLNLIKTTTKSFTDIAYECGFADQSHFIRTFKQFTGFLPSAFLNC